MSLKEQIGKALSHPDLHEHLAQQLGGVSGSPDQKVSKPDANYRQADTPGESCATCKNFDGEGGCAVVAGSIKPTMVSDHYTPAKTSEDSTAEGDQSFPPAKSGEPSTDELMMDSTKGVAH